MSDTITLKGITWNHSRGYVSVVATAQRFAEIHPGVKIVWEERSLQEFADYPIQQLAEKYDLLVIDHPWAGFAAGSRILLPLQDYLPADFLADQTANSVGRSFESYNFDGYHCALAIDAATPVAAYRPDLLALAEADVPQTWDDLLALAKKGWVALPGIPLDTLMNFYMLCATQGEGPFDENDEWVVSEAMGVQVLEQLRELTSYCTPEIFGWNPIAVYEALSSRNDLAYCPFAYGYSNYARPGYAANPLIFDDLVSLGEFGRLKTTLGGTGLAISSTCRNLYVALQYARYTASPECQRTVFFENGGQPGHRAAWLDETVNQRSNNFFKNTLPALDRAYLRPRYRNYLHFQDNAGAFVQKYLMHGGNPKTVLASLEKLYRESRAN
ncbi:MAG: extracellular solute-binding protein [Chloroflexi bacterium]|nr:MAG: extracellular solute-binding protein [Chloroflexota bacterium]